MKKILLIIPIMGLMFVTGCGTNGLSTGGDATGPWADTHETPQVVGSGLSALIPAKGCEPVLEKLRLATIKNMTERLDQARKQALEMNKYGGCRYWDEAMGARSPQANGPTPSGSAGAKDYSTTNNQIPGVAEADFVKNDGKNIYIIANNKFQILDAWPAKQAHKIAEVKLDGTPKRMFVYKDKVVIYSSMDLLTRPDMPTYPGGYGGVAMPSSVSNRDDCTYGYGCDFTGDGRAMKISEFDISDRTRPVLIRETMFNGSYVNSRRINSTVYTVVTFPEVAIAGLKYAPKAITEQMNNCEASRYTDEEINRMFITLLQNNTGLIESAKITDFLPSIKDTRYENGKEVREEGLMQGCGNFYLSQTDDGAGMLSVIAFDMTKPGAINSSTIVGRPGAVYASPTSLYIAVRHYAWQTSRWFYDNPETNKEATTIHKFMLEPDKVGVLYQASGVVPGRILNQFSMDEQDDYLRIATTTGHLPGPNVFNTVAVLHEEKGELKVVGLLNNIAPKEDIRSVRFNGNTGFMVTFKKTDPLFVLDFTDPTDPKIAGELKIPGYSTYIHLLDRNHLLSIGYDAKDEGNFAWFQGILLQVFDVTDISKPKLMYKEVIGTRGSTSEAATDHLAFTWFASRNLLAIPMVICKGGSGGTYGSIMTFSGLLVYRVTLDKGFEALGGVAHEAAEDPDNPRGACHNWWTRSNSLVKRSIFMEDWVYSIALDQVKVASINDLAHPVQSISLK